MNFRVDTGYFSINKFMLAVIAAIIALSVMAGNQAKCNCVAFRLDDVQDYYHTDNQISIIQAFANEKLTVGVIGGDIGNDTKLVSFLKSRPNLEFANHGWHHENFTLFSLSEQAELVRKSDSAIRKLFEKPTTFIPPYDELDQSVPIAVKQHGYRAISGYSWTDEGISRNNGITFVPGNVEFSDYSNNKWTEIPEPEIEKGIADSMAKNGYAVVVMHPIDPDSNVTKIAGVIDFAKEHGYSITTISDIEQKFR